MAPERTIFEKIIAGEIPADIIYETEDCLAFRDIDPQAPVHVLVVPKKRIERVGAAAPADQLVLGSLLLAAGEVARKLGVDSSGFRLAINHGPDGGESVPHLHVHLLAGRKMTWPPG